jgi:hypothetical protein
MADFVAVLKDTIEGLGDNRPAMRERVYQKARVTLATRLAVVGPPPAAVAERQKRVLEEAIAEVESSYAGPGEDDPIAELASILDYPRHADMCEGTAHDEAAIAACDSSTIQIEERAAPPPEPAIPVILARDSHTADSAEPAMMEKPGFETRGGEIASIGSKLLDVFADYKNPMEIRTIRLNGVAGCYAHELGWARSSLCDLCQKWALCIDQTHCWHRTDH